MNRNKKEVSHKAVADFFKMATAHDELELGMARKRKLAAFLWPGYSEFLDLLNYNAKLARWVKANAADVKRCSTRSALFEHLSRNVIGATPIDYLEFGVRGGWSMRQWAGLNTHPESRFFGFDSFTGLPERWNASHDAGAFDAGGAIPVIDDPRVGLVKGWFNDTLPGFLREFRPRNRLVINNDSDLYSSTLYVLMKLDDHIAPGTVILFDEFSSPLHEFKALEDYLVACKRRMKPLAARGSYFDTVAFEVQ